MVWQIRKYTRKFFTKKLSIQIGTYILKIRTYTYIEALVFLGFRVSRELKWAKKIVQKSKTIVQVNQKFVQIDQKIVQMNQKKVIMSKKIVQMNQKIVQISQNK